MKFQPRIVPNFLFRNSCSVKFVTTKEILCNIRDSTVQKDATTDEKEYYKLQESDWECTSRIDLNSSQVSELEKTHCDFPTRGWGVKLLYRQQKFCTIQLVKHMISTICIHRMWLWCSLQDEQIKHCPSEVHARNRMSMLGESTLEVTNSLLPEYRF
jgi:hypothetical protein